MVNMAKTELQKYRLELKADREEQVDKVDRAHGVIVVAEERIRNLDKWIDDADYVLELIERAEHDD